jgi:hypothetical protein
MREYERRASIQNDIALRFSTLDNSMFWTFISVVILHTEKSVIHAFVSSNRIKPVGLFGKEEIEKKSS